MTASGFLRLATFASLILLCRSASAQYGLPPVPPPPSSGQAHYGEAPAPAQAQPATTQPSEADLERARALFAEGLAFVAHEDWHNAAERFTQVLAIRSSPVVSYNLASALTHLGRLVESSKLLTQVLSDTQADAETRRAAQMLSSKIEASIGTLSISVYGNVEDCRFALDEQPIEISGAALVLRVDAGEHRIEVERDGATILSPKVTIGGTFPMHAQLSLEIPAKAQPVELALLPPPRKAPELALAPRRAPPPRDDESVLEQWWLWAGAGAVVAGAVIATLALSANDDPQPIAGNTEPGVIHTRVTGMTP